MTLNIGSRRGFTGAALIGLASAIAVGAGSPANAADPIPPPPPVAPIVVAPVQHAGFYLGVSALYMTRSNPAQAPILNEERVPAASPLPDAPVGDVLDARDFDFGFVWGVEARAGVVLPNNIGFEIGGFWLAPFYAFVGDDDPPPYVNLETDPSTFYIIYAYEGFNRTRIYGADANVVAHLGGGALQVYAGAAYVNVDDYMYLRLYRDGRDEFLNWASDNILIGPQVGARYTAGAGPFSIEVGGRVGYLHNSIFNVVVVDRPLDADLTGEDATAAWSLMAAGTITGRLAITEHFMITAGYQALWLGKVAQSPDQVGATASLDVIGPATVDLDTFVAPLLTHGFNVGLRLEF